MERVVTRSLEFRCQSVLKLTSLALTPYLNNRTPNDPRPALVELCLFSPSSSSSPLFSSLLALPPS
ncbi:hypothetical protein D9619_011056 [Psilocybe cf. subviscida]|uniref:Uncharacterized protein n=1 Tax=Psilocybe cf. subviscida TaxID=2480587 RepID=A0A8H5BAC1_9AGAR|nr:hypothetical protein D9619_011056 [Psilocybe cf. subviscida]